MFSSLIHQSPETKHLAERILAVAAAEKIFLLGATEHSKRTSSIFNYEQPGCRYTGHYHLLVLVSKTDEHLHTCLQDIIENNLQHFIPVTAIVLSIEQFSNWLLEGHPFASVVMQRSLLLHDGGGTLPQATMCNQEEQQESRQHYYTKGLNLVQEFLAGAELFRLRKQNALAAFMLHQSAEHGLRTLMKITTGLRTNSHNIGRLVRYCAMAVHGLTEVFNCDHSRSKTLFHKLQSAYIDARYKDYSITTAELLQLEQQVQHFITLFKQYNPGRVPAAAATRLQEDPLAIVSSCNHFAIAT